MMAEEYFADYRGILWWSIVTSTPDEEMFSYGTQEDYPVETKSGAVATQEGSDNRRTQKS